MSSQLFYFNFTRNAGYVTSGKAETKILFHSLNSRYNGEKWEKINENKKRNEKKIFKEEMKNKKDWDEVNENDN